MLFLLPIDVPDQSAIVRQYMRFTGQIQSGKNVREIISRGLQLYVAEPLSNHSMLIYSLRSCSRAVSDPKGPVYLWARREVMEEEYDESFVNLSVETRTWSPMEPTGLSANCE